MLRHREHRTPPVPPALLLAVLCACAQRDGGSLDRLQPPPDTGLVRIDMSGNWTVTHVETLDFATAYPTQPIDRAYPTGRALVPPVTGAVVRIADGILQLVDGADIPRAYAACTSANSGLEAFAYVNRTDGLFAVLDYGCRSRPDPRIADGGSSRLQIALGTIGQDSMLGYVRHEAAGAPIPPDAVVRGLHLVRLDRIASPSGRR